MKKKWMSRFLNFKKPPQEKFFCPLTTKKLAISGLNTIYRIFFLFFHSLRRLQVVDLVTRSGIFEKKNISIPTDNFLHTFNEFHKFLFNDDVEWKFYFLTRYSKFSQVLTDHGFCYTFNLAITKEMFNENSISTEFFHEHFGAGNIPNQTDTAIPRLIPFAAILRILIKSSKSYYKKIDNGLYEGHIIYIHDPYELPSRTTNRIFMRNGQTSMLNIEPIFNTIDDSLDELQINE